MTLLNHEFLTSKETQQLLRISESTMARWIADGTVPSLKLGGRRLIPRAAVEAVLAYPLDRDAGRGPAASPSPHPTADA